MENLISLVNRLQRACTALGDYGEESALPTLWDALPSIAVVGGQSSGKSSVLESVVGKDFLPRGSGIVTRRPLVLQLHRLEEGREYAEFAHQPKRKYTDFAAVRKEISDETDRETGRSKAISTVPIYLSIYSPNVVNLTLIDLPGLTKVAIDGQDESIVQEIENMVRSYIEKPNCIILAVSPANQDLATSDAIKMSREVDPKGERTFGVLTKVDLMDKGTDAVEILEGKSYKLQFPWIGVVNRSQADINKSVDMIAARRKEREYFANSPEYKHLAHRMGSEHLGKVLSKHLESVIKSRIPGLQSLINKTIIELETELSRLGKPVATDAGARQLQLSKHLSHQVETRVPHTLFVYIYITPAPLFIFTNYIRLFSGSSEMGRVSTAIFFCLLFISSVNSFYLPGVAPRDFQRGDPLQIKVNKLSSTKTQLPYDYYFLKYCKPQKIMNSAENLGEVLRGDRIENSIYTFHMREEQPCKVACRVKLDAQAAKNFKEKIDDEYRVNMILDNLPVAVLRQRRDGSQSTTYEHGFRVGFKGNYAGSKEEKYFINNHLSFRVMYHKDIETDSARIVGFEVTPNSINHQYKEWDEKNPQLATCNKNTKNIIQGSTVPQEVDTDKEVVFTYDVSFKESDIKWASRWDTYLLMNDDQIHWFSIINSLMIVLFLSGMVAMIMMRTLYRDIANYNQLESQDEAQEETGWKLVHGDVFRAPIKSGLLCVYVGTGVQVFAMTLVTMIFALLGFLSPSNRGGLMTAMVLLWVFMGLFAGYSSARLYKMLKGTEWKRNTLKTAFMFPGILFSIFFVLNALIWGEKSSGAVPFGTMIALVCLWFGISVPLVFVGSYLGFKKPAIEDPVKTNKIPRQVPEQAWYMTPIFSILIGGILPFGAVFIELFFILTSIWLNQFYYIFGFLFIVFVILIITCAEITIVLCYFQLCSEDYNWWWRAYLTAGSSALYLFLYSIFYFFTKLEITKLVSGILYFGYMSIASYAFFVLTGTIGFYSCFWFVRKIYASVKID